MGSNRAADPILGWGFSEFGSGGFVNDEEEEEEEGIKTLEMRQSKQASKPSG